MRRLFIVCAVLTMASWAFGQVTVISGYAGNQGWGSYYPPTPYVPLVKTPIVSLDGSSGLTVGASNATAGNVAGATNSTVAIVSPATAVVSLAPVFYGTAPVVGQSRTVEMQESASRSPYFETGVSLFEMSISAAQEARLTHSSRKQAARTYTNEDIDRINQQNGTVKYKGKTEQIS
jgi:hypothetical protein